ncbi:hypothetical protein AAX26_01148 [Aliarcobacter thereius]|uniref:Uncharacterized protein n=2 Tax=Aliarcobacter thereius TaxID=544718 RepID=A0A1C0B795_9BACT|nr:hypothetical protein [Aliarcobacter thereius]OCL86842.1 hypothetical protein AAX26_01148 [Aliarcobacter thereius]OCL91039.1 hypothetical protein AAX25_01207 [Aliarcobacter thereius]OCL96126.1 hypothetical protein AA347_01617 [Aliarcobacter thereius LMG 24486]OCL99460.1 hypothetical protein AAX29_01274 [Aliarcobacter thereius]QBF15903.1 putative membrane protein [Aliarcobacter thereius LMG 24486]
MRLKNTFISVFLILIIFISWNTYFDTYAIELNSNSLLETTIAFGSLKFLEALLSLASNTPFLGALFEPIISFLSYISNLFFLSLLSLSLQKVILIFMQSYILNSILTIIIFVYIINKFLNFLSVENSNKLGYIVSIVIFFRFSIIIMTFLTISFENGIKSYQKQIAEEKIVYLASKIESYEKLLLENNQTIEDKEKNSFWFGSLKNKSELALKNLKTYTKDLLEAYTLLVALFLFRNLILPLIFLWIFYKFITSMFRNPK